MIKFILTVAFAALSCMGTPASAADFKDVPRSNPYFSYINYLKSLGVVDGIGHGLFGPEQTLTRAQFAKLIAIAFQLDVSGKPVPFTDIKDHWAAAYIRTAYNAGIISGTSKTTFSPGKPIKREEAAVMVWRYAQKLGLSPGKVLNFREDPHSWAVKEINSVIAHGWYGEEVTENSGVWSYKPHATMTRQESAALIALALKDIPGSVSETEVSAGLNDSLDNFDQVLRRSNIYIESSQPAYFGNDAKRIARLSTEPGTIIYHTKYDISSIMIYSYFFSGIALEKSRLYVSENGKNYTEITAEVYPVGSPVSNWQQYAYEVSSLPPNKRYLKIELLGSAKSWSPQLSKVMLNRSTASVTMTSTRSNGSLQVELSSASKGAKIYYRTNNGAAFLPYSESLKLTGYHVLETYAVKDGKEPSPIRKYTLNGSSDYKVDRFGQMASAKFSGKVTSEEELKADAAADASYYGSLKPPADRDRYGGLAGSSVKYRIRGTGFFAIQQLGSRKVMKTPEGNIFFSIGINGITANETYTMVKSRERDFEWLPPHEGQYRSAFITPDHGSFSFYMANKYRKTGVIPTESSLYAEAVLRLKKWGFNSAGGFSPDKYGKINNFPYVRMLPLNSMSWAKIDGISIFDIFAPDAEAKMDRAFEKALTPNKNDPLLIGYFIDNEYDFHKFYSHVPKLKASSAAIKGRLVQTLKNKYEDIDAFNNSWKTSFKSFEDLKEAELPLHTSPAWRDMDEFFRFYLDTFFGTVSRIYRKYDPNHLLLGDRWITTSFHNEKFRSVLAEVEGKYVDVISINYYSYKIETDLLKDVYTKSGGKPILISEFGYGTAEQGLAPLLPNSAVNQFQRGMRYRNYVEGVAGLDYIVGAHLFNYVDQAGLGRYWQGLWGEHYNSGLVNVADRPYKEYLKAIMETNYDIYKVIGKERPKFYYDFSKR